MNQAQSVISEIDLNAKYPKVAGENLVQLRRQGYEVEFIGQSGRCGSLYRISDPVNGQETIVEWAV
ncbi:MAG: hypothetical protein SFT81_03435 [Candidatus Caenarcaniphilales bacterium]|nr:hypothetical protein [Candidatus Caenarcaniphilales bacterium]